MLSGAPISFTSGVDSGGGMADDVASRVTAALRYINLRGGDDVREHYIWLLRHVLSDMTPEDLTNSTLVSLLAVLAPEHSRVLADRRIGGIVDSGAPGGSGADATLLRLVRESEATVYSG